MLDEKTERKRIIAGSRLKDSLRNIREVRPLNTVYPEILQGLFNICTMESSIISRNAQRDLMNTLKGDGTLKYYYISLEHTAELPHTLKYLHLKCELSNAEPNQIRTLDIDKFKFKAYAIHSLNYDTPNSFYFIVHMRDTVRFMQMINKANSETKFQKESREADYEQIEDITNAYDIETILDYDKIFKLDEYDRKLLFTYAKKAGLGKQERELLKTIRRKAGGQPFYMYVESLEEAIEEEENEAELERLEKELLRVTEENNSWNNYKTLLDDYY